MLCSSDTSHMASAGHHVYCHSSTGEGSNPRKACSLTVVCVHTYACVRVCMDMYDMIFARETSACDWEKNKRQSKWCWGMKEKENSGGVRGVLLFSSCLSLWKVWKCFFRWNQWKRSTLKGATNSLWARKYVRTGAHLSQNRRHCTPLLLIFYLSASFFFCLSLPVYYFWSVHLPIFVRHSFFSICRPLFFFFPFSFVCCVSAPPVSHYFNPICKAHAYTMSLYPCLSSFLLHLLSFFHQRFF